MKQSSYKYRCFVCNNKKSKCEERDVQNTENFVFCTVYFNKENEI